MSVVIGVILLANHSFHVRNLIFKLNEIHNLTLKLKIDKYRNNFMMHLLNIIKICYRYLFRNATYNSNIFTRHASNNC